MVAPTWHRMLRRGRICIIGTLIFTLAACSIETIPPSANDSDATAATALAAAHTAQTQVAAMETTVGTAVAIAQAAAATAAAAAAKVDIAATSTTAPTRTPTPTATASDPALMVPLEGGIRLDYQTEHTDETQLYHVDHLVVYRDLASFRNDWNSKFGAVPLALIETAAEADTWQLFYADPLSTTTTVTPTAWREYSIVAELQRTSDDGGARSVPSPLVINQILAQEELPQSIIASGQISSAIDLPISDSLDQLPSPELIRKLLVREETPAGDLYTLIVIDPNQSGAGSSPSRQFCRLVRNAWQWLCRQR